MAIIAVLTQPRLRILSLAIKPFLSILAAQPCMRLSPIIPKMSRGFSRGFASYAAFSILVRNDLFSPDSLPNSKVNIVKIYNNKFHNYLVNRARSKGF